MSKKKKKTLRLSRSMVSYWKICLECEEMVVLATQLEPVFRQIEQLYTQTHVYNIYIYIYIERERELETDCFVVSQIFSVARHLRRSSPGLKPHNFTSGWWHTPKPSLRLDISLGINAYVLTFVCLLIYSYWLWYWYEEFWMEKISFIDWIFLPLEISFCWFLFGS